MSATTAGVILGTLKEQHADCIVLRDSTRIPLAVGLTLDPILAGADITVSYSRDSNGRMVVTDIKLTEPAQVLAAASERGLRLVL